MNVNGPPASDARVPARSSRLAVVGVLLVASLLLSAAPGCAPAPAPEQATRLKLMGDAVRSAPLGKRAPWSLRVLAVDKRGRRVPGVPVRFRLVASNGDGSARVEALKDRTDAGGVASAEVVCGKRFGFYTVIAESADPERRLKPARLYVIAGLRVIGNSPDIGSGGWADIELHFEREIGRPLAGVEILFDLRRAPKGVRLIAASENTDAEGMARLRVRGGSDTGKCEIGVRIIGRNLKAPLPMPSLRLKAFVINGWSLVIQVLGGLAVFILGMRLMSEGLSLIAGNRMRHILGWFTGSRVTGLLCGLGVTALIQSSSACTVMLVGFVNAGLMGLRQAVGVVLGTNIGTTVTAQLVSFKLTRLALPAVVLGVALTVIARSKRPRYYAQVLLGFGLLFMGMSMMSSPLKGLNECETVRSIFRSLDCRPVQGVVPWGPALMGILVGAATTMIVQSSSAAIGLLLALTGSGLIDVWTAFPILLGDNIGTTITAILASLTANRASKQVACAHALFNIFGALYMYLLLFVPWRGEPVFLAFVDWLTPGNAFEGENATRFVANCHTTFNVTNAIVFLPLTGVLARLCMRIIPDRREDTIAGKELFRYLEPHLLATPGLAIEQARRELAYMVVQAHKSMTAGFSALVGGGDASAEQYTRRHEERIDQLQEALLDYLARLGARELTEEQAGQLPLLVHSVNDIERVGDHAVALVRLARRMDERKITFSPLFTRQAERLREVVVEMFGLAADLLNRKDGNARERLLGLEEDVDTLCHEFRRAHLRQMDRSQEDARSGVVFLEALNHLERIADHLAHLCDIDDSRDDPANEETPPAQEPA